MSALSDKHQRIVDRTAAQLRDDLGDRLVSLVLYGAPAHGDHHGDEALHLLVVVSDLEPATLRRLHGGLRTWRRRGLPSPRLFSPGLLAASTDVFPIELDDIAHHHLVVHGADPLVGLVVEPEHLRIQCERELTEKLMRLREGYVEHGRRPRALRRLIATSWPSFATILRGALRLFGKEVPARDLEVARAVAAEVGVAPDVFAEVEALRRGERAARAADPDALYARYYAALEEVERAVDRFTRQGELR